MVADGEVIQQRRWRGSGIDAHPPVANLLTIRSRPQD
jgi:hypothetical protein